MAQFPGTPAVHHYSEYIGPETSPRKARPTKRRYCLKGALTESCAAHCSGIPSATGWTLRNSSRSIGHRSQRSSLLTGRGGFNGGGPNYRRSQSEPHLHLARRASNLTMRMPIRRFTRLTNGFSKKFEKHWAALALYFAYYNFCRIHSSIRVTPAMPGSRIMCGTWRNCWRRPIVQSI